MSSWAANLDIKSSTTDSGIIWFICFRTWLMKIDTSIGRINVISLRITRRWRSTWWSTSSGRCIVGWPGASGGEPVAPPCVLVLVTGLAWVFATTSFTSVQVIYYYILSIYEINSGLALAGRQVADGYYSYHPATNFLFVANFLFVLFFCLATRIFLPCGVVECRLMLKKLTIFLWCAYIWN